MTIQELTQNEKYKFWYLKIKECKESDLSVQDFCEKNNIKVSTYYKYQQKIKTVLCNHINNEAEPKNEVAFIPVDKQVCNNPVFDSCKYKKIHKALNISALFGFFLLY